MKKIFSFIVIIVLGFTMLTACSKEEGVTPDYDNVVSFEKALNADEDCNGKIVVITVYEIHPNSAFGYNIYSGEHLNFVSDEKPKCNVGDTITVKIIKVTTFMGSYIIKYEIV